MERLRRLWSLLVLVLASCTPEPPALDSSPDLKPFPALAVRSVDVRVSATPTLAPPHIEADMPISPARAVHAWLEEEIASRGRGRLVLVLDITQAEVTETRIPISQGLSDWFTDSQQYRYDGAVQVEARLLRADGSEAGAVRVLAGAFLTTPESASVDEREQAWDALNERLIQQLDKELRARLPALVKRLSS